MPARRTCAARASVLKALAVERSPSISCTPPIPRSLEASLAALAELREQGKIRWVGLSNVTVAQIERPKPSCRSPRCRTASIPSSAKRSATEWSPTVGSAGSVSWPTARSAGAGSTGSCPGIPCCKRAADAAAAEPACPRHRLGARPGSHRVRHPGARSAARARGGRARGGGPRAVRPPTCGEIGGRGVSRDVNRRSLITLAVTARLLDFRHARLHPAAPPPASPVGAVRRLGASGRRAVDDEHRHRRRRRPRCDQVAALARAGLAARARHREQRGGRGGGPGDRRARSTDAGVNVPIVGDFHYNGHLLLTQVSRRARGRSPSTASIRATSAASGATRTSARSSRSRVEHGKPVRIGVNWGSLDQDLLTQMMDENARAAEPRDAKRRHMEAMLASALRSARAGRGDRPGARPDHHLAPRSRGVQDLVDVYRELAARCDYPLHLGLTEAGMGMKGIVASTAALSILLQEGIGDTIRVSLTPEAERRPHRGGAGRAADPAVARAAQLRAAGDRVPGLRAHDVARSSSRWRRTSRTYLREQMPVWRASASRRRGA